MKPFMRLIKRQQCLVCKGRNKEIIISGLLNKQRIEHAIKILGHFCQDCKDLIRPSEVPTLNDYVGKGQGNGASFVSGTDRRGAGDILDQNAQTLGI